MVWLAMTCGKRNRRSAVIYPALQPERFADGVASGTDIVVFDLEDGTAPERKAEARDAVADAFAGHKAEAPLRYLRINHPNSVDGLRDMLAVIDWPAAPDGLLLPKIESPEEILQVSETVCSIHPGIELTPIIESPRGLENVFGIANASDRVAMLLLGSHDLSGTIGSDQSRDALAYARGRLVMAAGDAGIDAMDSVFDDPEDAAGLIEETRRAANMGFTGKASYHTNQIAHIHAAFTPTAEQIAAARRMIDAFEANDTGTLRLDGRLVNAATVKQARRVIAIAERRGVLGNG